MQISLAERLNGPEQLSSALQFEQFELVVVLK